MCFAINRSCAGKKPSHLSPEETLKISGDGLPPPAAKFKGGVGNDPPVEVDPKGGTPCVVELG